MKIYAADDERFMLEALIESIRQVLPQAEITGFRNSTSLLAKENSAPCDIAFLDIHMASLSGTELAKRILEIKPDTNIIFVTGYEKYKAEAMDLFASAYIIKPVTTENILNAVKHLRYPIDELSRDCQAITFGNFALYVDKKPVQFHRKKSAELLAYLIDRGGSTVTRQELTWIIFGDESHSRPSQKYLNSICHTLEDDLKAVGAINLLYKGPDGLSINRYLLKSDLYDYLSGNTELYHGEYMEQYSWGERFKAEHWNDIK